MFDEQARHDDVYYATTTNALLNTIFTSFLNMNVLHLFLSFCPRFEISLRPVDMALCKCEL